MRLALGNVLPELLLVELLQLRVGAAKVAARRGDVPMSGKPLRGRDIHLRRPLTDFARSLAMLIEINDRIHHETRVIMETS